MRFEYELDERYCPLIKEKCKQKECVFCNHLPIEKEEGKPAEDTPCCLVAVYLFDKTIGDILGEAEETHEDIESERKKAPEELKSATAEQLAEKLLVYYKESGLGDPFYVNEAFWEKMGVESKYYLPPEEKIKIQKAEEIVNRTLVKEEKEKLPPLIGSCAEWAKEKGIKKITLGEVQAFLSEKDITLLRENQRELWSRTNIELKKP